VGGDQQTGKTAAEQAKQEKADRLAKALRDNLHRRKAQARARKSHAIDTAETSMAAMMKTDNSPQGDG
jgi:vacuolar-type H+-ATPase subunit E/Vma4